MKTSVIRKAVLSVALSAALAASVCGASYRQSDAVEKEERYQVTSRNASVKPNGKQEYGSQAIETIISSVVDDDIDNIDFVYNELYSAYNEEYGYVVDFTYGGENGYAIVSADDGSEDIIELNLGSSSPYTGKDGKYIYASFDNYFVVQDNGDIVSVSADHDGLPVSETLNNGDDGKTNIPEPRDYSYSYGSFECFELKGFRYQYSSSLLTDKKNKCAPAAGVIALNYWNKYYDNRILKLNESEFYKDSDTNVVTDNMSDEVAKNYMGIFYKYMKTNSWLLPNGELGGTTPKNAYLGFMQLIEEKGFNARKCIVRTFADIKNNIGIEKRPVFITSDDYYFTERYNYVNDKSAKPLPSVDPTPGDHTFTIDYRRFHGIIHSHTFIGFGYAEYTLYDADGNESKIELVKIADGWGGERYFNFNISDTTNWGMAAIKVSLC